MAFHGAGKERVKETLCLMDDIFSAALLTLTIDIKEPLDGDLTSWWIMVEIEMCACFVCVVFGVVGGGGGGGGVGGGGGGGGGGGLLLCCVR